MKSKSGYSSDAFCGGAFARSSSSSRGEVAPLLRADEGVGEVMAPGGTWCAMMLPFSGWKRA